MLNLTLNHADSRRYRSILTRLPLAAENRTNLNFSVRHPRLFLSLQEIATFLLHLRKRSCEEIHGVYDSSVGICISLKLVTKGIDKFTTYAIGMSGTVLSIICLFILLITYTLFSKELQTLPGKNIMCLSGTLMLTHIIYAISLRADTHAELCQAVGILLHWSIIYNFVWMVVIAFDLYTTFGKPLRLSSIQKGKRFPIYLGFTSGSLIFVLMLCVTLEFSGKSLMGYGAGNICFVAKFWANLFSFVVPVGFILLLNTILLILTVRSIHKTQEKARKSLSKNSSCKNNKLHFTLMTLKLTTLTGLGWIFAFIANLLQSPALTYLSIALISLQGLFVFVGFVCTKRVCKLYREKLQRVKVTTASGAITATTIYSDTVKAESSL